MNLPSIIRNKLTSFTSPQWDKFSGERGAFVATSLDGTLDAIAEPLSDGWRFWLVRTSDGETLHEDQICAAV